MIVFHVEQPVGLYFPHWLLLSAQLERRATFILFSLFVRIPDFFEAVLTDGVFNQAGFVFGDFRVYARSDQLRRKNWCRS